MKTLQQQFGTDSLHNTQLLLAKGGNLNEAQGSNTTTNNDDPHIRPTE